MRTHPSWHTWLLLLAAGCATADYEGAEGERLARSAVPTWQEYLASAERAGESFIVEGDMWLRDEHALRQYYDFLVGEAADKAHVAKELSSQNWLIWPPNKATDIRYCVSEAAFDAEDPAFYQRAIDELVIATQQWEDVANINFKHVPSEDDDCTPDNPNIDIAVSTTNQGNGCSSLPMFYWESDEPIHPFLLGQCGQEGDLKMNYHANNPAFSTLGVLRHELGHAIGFRHEHPWFFPEGGGDPGFCGEYRTYTDWNVGGEGLVNDQDAYDELSVMHYRTGCGHPGGNDYLISELDGVSARKLYGMPVAWYVGAGVF